MKKNEIILGIVEVKCALKHLIDYEARPQTCKEISMRSLFYKVAVLIDKLDDLRQAIEPLIEPKTLANFSKDACESFESTNIKDR